MALRKPFSETADHNAPAPEAKSSLACVANRCPMPGAIFPNSGKEGVCSWHYGMSAHDWPRVTQTLEDWACVTLEINIGRRALCGAGATSPKHLDEAYRTALERLRPAVMAGGWGETFEAKTGERYEDWLRRLERFLEQQIRSALGSQRQLEPSHVD